MSSTRTTLSLLNYSITILSCAALVKILTPSSVMSLLTTTRKTFLNAFSHLASLVKLWPPSISATPATSPRQLRRLNPALSRMTVLDQRCIWLLDLIANKLRRSGSMTWLSRSKMRTRPTKTWRKKFAISRPPCQRFTVTLVNEERQLKRDEASLTDKLKLILEWENHRLGNRVGKFGLGELWPETRKKPQLKVYICLMSQKHTHTNQ